MKQVITRRLTMRLSFMLLVTGEVMGVTMISWAATELLHRYFSITLNTASFIWLILLSTVIGSGITSFITKQFIGPVTQLEKAMSRVASGDFTVHLNEKHRFREIRDIYSNFNLMVQELQATEILQTDFVSNVSHEFKTPINAIEGYATLLQDDGSNTPEERTQYVNKILLNTRRLSNLAGNILLLSKVDHQAIQVHQATFRLDEQIRQVIVMLEAEWSKKDIEFDVSMDELAYTGNENLLSHVWSNLIGNAIKFNPVGGLIRISLRRESAKLRFIIEDSGPGIDETVKKHMFDKFYQGDSSHKEEGNGLGLALVKQIISACHGEITAENISGGGTRFIVVLPEQPLTGTHK